MMKMLRKSVFPLLAMLLGPMASTGASAGDLGSFDVFAKENSLAFFSLDASPLDTGLFFNAGDALKITATGTWSAGACGSYGPDGTNCMGDAFPGINISVLGGRFGASGSIFKVGSSFDGTANGTGNLFLFFVDSDSFNNSGFVTARVASVEAPIPEPETWALLASGLGLLAWRSRRRVAC